MVFALYTKSGRLGPISYHNGREAIQLIRLYNTNDSQAINKYSANITQPKSQGASQAMLYATGLTREDMNKAQVGIASVWYEGNPCNMHLNKLAGAVKKGVEESGLVGYRFNTIGVSDGISMGTTGMRYSLQSREIIADSIETVMGAQWYDANISIPGCDKNMPGCLMAMGRVNRPSIMVYGGTIRAGCGKQNTPIDIVSAFQSYGEFISGRISEDERYDIVRNACPGPGACGGMYTANTMAVAIETLGMSLPYSSSLPADDPGKIKECLSAGKAIKNLMENDIKPRDIMTRKAFENAIAITMALGGSTNAVLHLIAMAKTVQVPLTLDDFQDISDKVPFLADLKPSGKYVMEDIQTIGGTPAVIKYLLEKGILYGDCLTVTGKTIEENVKDMPGLLAGQSIIHPIEHPIKETGHLTILRGNLATGGAVAKITGKEGMVFEGTALVYNSEQDMLRAFEGGEIHKKSVIIIRYEGPKGGPGMPEMCMYIELLADSIREGMTPTSAIMGAGMGSDVALITDGRFSGGSHGFIIGHVTPEAQAGGNIALVEKGDCITIDATSRTINLHVPDAVLAERRLNFKSPPYKCTSGTLYKFIKSVSTATDGCVTDV